MNMKSLYVLVASLAAVSVASPMIEERDNTVVTCTQTNIWRAPKDGFRTFIDNIPDERYDLQDARLPYGFGTTYRGRAMTANLDRKSGIHATGSHIRSMLHKGYAECVLSGENDSGDSFYQFRVENPGYTILAGGGPAAGSYGLEGTLVSVKSPGSD